MNSPKAQLYLFGSPEMNTGNAVKFMKTKPEKLIVCLALDLRRQATTELLCARLYPDSDRTPDYPEDAIKNLASRSGRVKSVGYHAWGFKDEFNNRLSTDLDQFHAAIRAARQEMDKITKRELLASALALASRGTFLADWNYEWVLPLREKVEHEIAEAKEMLEALGSPEVPNPSLQEVDPFETLISPAHEESTLTRIYLKQLVETFRWLELQVIREAGTLRIELQKVFVALKAEPETEYDRQQASNLHSIEVLEAAGVSSVDMIDPNQLEDFDATNIRLTFRPSREEAKRVRVTDVQTLGSVFRQHRRVVILGGPGSGKTTLGRWLTLQLASASLRTLDLGRLQRVTVPVSQIDPDSSAEEPVDLGPARLPIFLRLSHFARELAERAEKHQPSLALVDYLGHDPDSCSLGDGLTPEVRHTLFLSSLENGKSVVILDGLDELSDANRRLVVLKIQDFIEKHIPSVGPDDIGDQPWTVGGNQVVVTSRYVGYRFAPVQAGCLHYGIQPMRRSAVERFARSWTEAVNAKLASEGGATLAADQLIAEIYNEAKPKVRELATNPLLITILATVYWRDGKLPDQRAGVYDRVVENLIELWLKREECLEQKLAREELLAALEPLAADMQESLSSNGLISLARIGELVEGPLAHMSGMNPTDRRFRPRLDALLTTIRKHVGLLAEQSSGNYAFFHRTFQEFLAARHLLAERTTAAEKISERIDDPIWREPLLLALGFVTISWGPEESGRLLEEVLAVDPPDALVPRATLLLVAALPDLRNTPTNVVEQIVVRLLTSYMTSLEKVQARGLSDQIEQSFVHLRLGAQSDAVAKKIAEVIRLSASGRDLSGAAATILRHLDWFTPALVESLLSAMHRDRADLGWPIHEALLAALGPNPEGQPWLTSVPDLVAMHLVGTYLPMRKLLEPSQELVTLIRGDNDWLSLIVALYGGLTPYRFTAQMEQNQEQCLEAIKYAASGIPVLLEAEANLTLNFPIVEFSPQNIVRDLTDPDLGRLIIRHLSAHKPARDLIDTFRNRWEAGGNSGGSAEALIGLAALGEDVLPLLRNGLVNDQLQSAGHAALKRFGWLKAQLREPLVATSEAAVRTLPEEATEQCKLDLLRITLTARMTSGGAPLLVSTKIPTCNFFSSTTPAVRAALEAEYWSYVFSGYAGDGRDEEAQSLIWSAQVIWSSSLEDLLHSWSVIHCSCNRFALRRLPWPQAILAPRADTSVERYLAMLEAMSCVPDEYHIVAGSVLARCSPILKANPALIWETLLVCWSQGEQFIRGYRNSYRGCNEQEEEFQLFENFLDSLIQDDIIMANNNSRNGLSWSTLIQKISMITDAHLQFRAQWRFIGLIIGNEEIIRIDISRILDQISDINEQISAIEWILTAIPRSELSIANHNDLLEPLVNNLSRIFDPENRARAQCRLALFASGHLETLLYGAVESVCAIADPVRKATTITEIRATWGSIAGMSEALDAAAQTISEPWERDKALGRASLLVQTFRKQYHTRELAWRLPSTNKVFRQGHQGASLPWVILYLSTMAAELEALATIPRGTLLWDRLLGDERHDATTERFGSGLEKGIIVTAREASILDRFLQTDQAKEVENLWPILDCPDPGAIGIVARWLPRDDRAGQWSALVQAESGSLTPEVVSSVIELAANSTDRLRLRAMLALHGSTPYTNNINRRWVIRRIGAETLDVLARYATQNSNSPALQSGLNWVHADIHHDDTTAIEEWLKQVASDGLTSPAAWILRNLQSVKATVTPLLLSALQSSSPNVHSTLLFGLARLANCSSEFRDSSKDIHIAIASIPRELRSWLSVLPKGPTTLLQIAKDSVEATPSGNGLHHARRLFESQRIWLDETTLSDDKTCLWQLQKIGAGFYIPLTSYWEETNRMAATLATNERVLQLLLAWLAETNVNADPDGYNHHLITAIEALTRFSPDAFAVLAPPEYWEPILTGWAQYAEHWTARMAAVRLLGRLRRVTTRVAGALRVAMDDVSFVQQAAYESVTEFRRIEGDIFPELLQMIDDPSAAVAAATTKLLVSIPRAELSPTNRRLILDCLQQRASQPSMARPVYLMNEFNINMTIGFVENLDRILYRAIFDISGL